jgi:hypothetical protein
MANLRSLRLDDIRLFVDSQIALLDPFAVWSSRIITGISKDIERKDRASETGPR